jgi:hypothetical protein
MNSPILLRHFVVEKIYPRRKDAPALAFSDSIPAL